MPQNAMAVTAGNVWRFRMLAATLARHHMILKYRSSILGFVWTLLSPFAMMMVLVAVFSFVVRIRIDHYWAFLLSGYFVWVFIQNVLGASTGLLRDYSALRRSIPFPNEVALMGALGARLVEFGAALMLIVLVLAVFHHQAVPPSFILIPALIVLQALLVFALALPLCTLGLLYHDVEHAVPIVVGLLFYGSPIFYPASLVPDVVRDVYLLNPIAGLLTLYHSVLYEGVFPAPGLVLVTLITTLVLLFAGYAYFNRHRAVLPEIG
jgi:lipopolysaccharide transport system permease protein